MMLWKKHPNYAKISYKVLAAIKTGYPKKLRIGISNWDENQRNKDTVENL